jgi:hypothetical protein
MDEGDCIKGNVIICNFHLILLGRLNQCGWDDGELRSGYLGGRIQLGELSVDGKIIITNWRENQDMKVWTRFNCLSIGPKYRRLWKVGKIYGPTKEANFLSAWIITDILRKILCSSWYSMDVSLGEPHSRSALEWRKEKSLPLPAFQSS